MSLTILVLVVIVALAAAFFVMMRREGVAVSTAVLEVLDEADGVVSDPIPVNGIADVSKPERITWTKQFDAGAGPLDADARLRLINDLGLLRAPWCVPVLEQASREERDPTHRDAAQRALSLCRVERLTNSDD